MLRVPVTSSSRSAPEMFLRRPKRFSNLYARGLLDGWGQPAVDHPEYPLGPICPLAGSWHSPDGDDAVRLAQHGRVSDQRRSLSSGRWGRIYRAEPEFDFGGGTLCVSFPNP